MKVTVFKSERTGELFETEEEYNLHMAEIAKKEDIKIDEARRYELLHHPRLTATSVQDFQNKALVAINEFYASRLVLKSLKISVESILHEVRHDWHCAPVSILHNHKRTYGGTSLGWRVHISFLFTKLTSGLSPKALDFPKIPGVNIGRCENDDELIYKFYGRLFLEDFPLLKQQYERYIELVKKEEEWKNTIETLFQKEMNSDKVVTRCNELIADYLSQINALHSSLEKEEKIRHGREILSRKEILFSHPFPELQEMEKLKEEFKFS